MKAGARGLPIVTFWPFLQLVLMEIVTLGCLVDFAGTEGSNLLPAGQSLQSAGKWVVAAREGSGMGR